VLVLDDPAQVRTALDDCVDGDAVCDPPSIACIHVDDVTETELDLSVGLDCIALRDEFVGWRQ
jgi:hypothetical protein